MKEEENVGIVYFGMDFCTGNYNRGIDGIF